MDNWDKIYRKLMGNDYPFNNAILSIRDSMAGKICTCLLYVCPNMALIYLVKPATCIYCQV